jgi:hypothetical protein
MKEKNEEEKKEKKKKKKTKSSHLVVEKQIWKVGSGRFTAHKPSMHITNDNFAPGSR